MLFQW